MHNPSLYHRFQHSARAHADRIAIRSETGDIRYAELETESRAVAAALLALGINRGDRIAIWGVNSAEWIITALAIQAVGGVLIPIGTRLRGREVSGILTDAKARIVFCDEGFGSYSYVDALEELDLPQVERIVVLDGKGGGAEGRRLSLDALRGLGAGVAASDLDARIAQGSGDDLADIIFTSGTTGKPKGVLMTHGQSLVACDIQREEINRFTADDVFAVTYPFAHNAGYRAGWQVSLLYGVRIIPVRTFDAEQLLQLIEREGVTILPTAPPVAQGILDHADRQKADLSSLRYIATGGTTIPVKLVEELRRKLGASTVVATGYGLTETAGSVTNTRDNDAPDVIARTVGRPISNLEVKIVGPDGSEVSQGGTGEIAVRGPQVTRGYLDNPEATAKAFTSDGFLLTGDAGLIDADGNIRITDRIKDMYLVGGFNCYPAEIERIMGMMPGIANVAVIGVDDERLGQVGRAFVVRQPGASISQDDVINWCRAEMANYKLPRSVVFLDALPLNATGKVAKTELREMA